jgi:hypothetical protein
MLPTACRTQLRQVEYITYTKLNVKDAKTTLQKQTYLRPNKKRIGM